jgi:hypothetical protein
MLTIFEASGLAKLDPLDSQVRSLDLICTQTAAHIHQQSHVHYTGVNAVCQDSVDSILLTKGSILDSCYEISE